MSMSLVSKMAADLELILPSMKSLNSCRSAEDIRCSCSLNNFVRSDMMGQFIASKCVVDDEFLPPILAYELNHVKVTRRASMQLITILIFHEMTSL